MANALTIFTFKIYNSGNIFLKMLKLISPQTRHPNVSNTKTIAQFRVVLREI